jgi:2-keto-4-pentenoate hydratase
VAAAGAAAANSRKGDLQMSAPIIQTLAEKLDAAMRTGAPLPHFDVSESINSLADAYAIQSAWTAMRVARGEKIMGRKIGLTAKAVQEQLGVDQPDYGTLWQSSFHEAKNGAVTIAASDFIAPRIEGEIAFLIGKSLDRPGIMPADVLAATEACALGVEIVDSRIADWKIKFFDTIADNASYGGFTLGPWDRKLRDADLAAIGMTISQNGAPVAEGTGAAVLGGPAISCAWLANKLLEFGVSLKPGDVVISGALMKMIPFKAGDRFIFDLAGQPPLTVTIV